MRIGSKPARRLDLLSERPRPAAKRGAPGHEAVVPPLQPRPHPGDEAILWTPWKQWVTGTTVEAPWDIVLTQTVLATILEQEMRADSDVTGVMWGKLFRCPTSGRRWVRADHAWHAPAALSEACDASELAAALGPAGFEAGDASGVRVGWYHSHAHLGATLTESESQFHEREFPKPWQFVLIPVARSDPAGGVFLRGPGGVLSRTGYARFYELPRIVRSDGSRETMIHWQNYTTDSRVHLIDPTSLRDLASGQARSSGVVPARLEGPATRPRRSRGGTPGAGDTPELPAEEGDLAGPPTRSRPPRWRRAVATAVAGAALVFAGWYGWERYGPGAEAAAEFSAPRQAEGSGASFSARPSARDAFRSALTALESALDTYAALQGSPQTTCDGLASAVTRAESAFRAAARAYAALGVTSPGAGRAEYESAVVRMVDANGHFASSGCNRPEERP